MFSRHWALTVSWRHPICDQLWLLFSGERRHPYRSGKRKAWYVVSTTDECYVGVSCAVRYFDVVLMHRLSRPTNVDVHMWCISAFGSSNEKLMLLSKLYLQLETVELRWCPFKRSVSTYYRNADPRFLPPTKCIRYEVGRILSSHESITCNNCPSFVNSRWRSGRSDTSSVFQPLLRHIVSMYNSEDDGLVG